jgi:RHS repeat-associated protein
MDQSHPRDPADDSEEPERTPADQPLEEETQFGGMPDGLLFEYVHITGDDGGEPPPDAERYRFTSRDLDPNTALLYNRANSYDPRLGRWLSENPPGFVAADPSLYRYVAPSPEPSSK